MTKSSCKISVWSICYLKYILSDKAKAQDLTVIGIHSGNLRKSQLSECYEKQDMSPGQDCKTDCYWKLERLLHFHLEQLRGNELLRWNSISSQKEFYAMTACDSTEADSVTQQKALQLPSWVLFRFCGWKNKKHGIVRIVEIGPFCKLYFTVIFAAAIPLLLGERMWKGK